MNKKKRDYDKIIKIMAKNYDDDKRKKIMTVITVTIQNSQHVVLLQYAIDM